ncbi:MAG: hypothetical protein ABMB14_14810 [Myxococcota bacterium]
MSARYLVALAFTVGCTSHAPPVSPVPAPAPAPAPVPGPVAEPAPAPVDDAAPRPYTADQLRAAMPVGTVIRYRITDPDGVVENRMEVTAATDVSATITSVVTDAAGAVLRDEGAADSAWTELVDHAKFPAAATVIEDASVTVPAGTFAVKRYTVTAPDGVRVFDFAPALPGPPVRMTQSVGGQVVGTMELVERK